jgi:LacI family gluconate utilization system Gnt-I transcriptional repressor
MLVGFSHEKIGVAVADFLHQRGRRRIALLSGDDERALRRNRSFAERLRQLGLAGEAGPPTCLVPAPTTLGAGRSGLAELLANDPAIDAVFCSSDLLALGVLTEAQARGLPVPGQLAVMGLGDLAFARDLHPALTTVRIDGTSIGRIAAGFIVDRAEGREVADRVRDIGFSIVERAST